MVKQWAIFVAVFLALLTALVWSEHTFSPIFQQCVCESEQHNSDSTPEKQTAGYEVIAIANTQCTGSFLDAHSGGITALATVLIAALTATLRGIGYRQWRTYEAQKNLTHRPRLVVRNVNLLKPLSATDPIEVCFELINRGASDAIIEMGTAHITISEAPPWRQYTKLPIPEDGELHYIDNWMKRHGPEPTLRPGVSEIVVKSTKHPPSPERIDAVDTIRANRPQTYIFIVGYVWYSDRDGVHYRTGFCRRYPNNLHRFDAVTDSDLEYED